MASCTSQFLCVVLLLVFAHLGDSLKCYSCKSTFNGDCDDVRGKTLPNELCENSKLVKAFPQIGSRYVCVLHRMQQKDDKELNVVRGCAPDNYCASFQNSKECLTCETDLCNSSSALLPSFVLISIINFMCAKCYL